MQEFARELVAQLFKHGGGIIAMRQTAIGFLQQRHADGFAVFANAAHQLLLRT